MIIEMKYNGDVQEALNQAKGYIKLIKDKDNKLFIGLNVTEDKKVEIKYLLSPKIQQKKGY